MIRAAVATTGREEIGVRLRRLRTEKGLSQRELAAPGVSYAYISRIEAGTRRPSVKALRKLARKLGVTPEYLETGSDIRDVDERELRLSDAELRLRLDASPEDARAAFAELLEEAIDAGDARSVVRARIGLGLAAANAGAHAESVARLEEAIESGELSPAVRPDVYATLARSLTSVGASERAIELLERCIDDLETQEPENVTAYVRFAGYLGAALTDVGELGRAESVLSGALERAESTSDAYTRIRVYWSLARLAESEGRSVEALEYVRRAIALLEATDDTQHLARAHLLCAWIMDLQENAREASPHLETAEQLLGPHPDAIDLAMLRVEQAKCAAQLNKGGKAVSQAHEALALLGEGGTTGAHGNAWWALAEGLALQDDLSGSTDAFRRAVDLLDQNGFWREAAQASRRWAKVLRDAGRDSDALDALERATDYAVRTQSVVHSPLER
jgi:transcriptional regulator with XRE-family HTH domain